MITKDMVEMVRRVTAKQYSEEKVKKVLEKSQKISKSKTPEETVFYNVCLWLDSNVITNQTQTELINKIASSMRLNSGSVRNCLASHPFAVIPKHLKFSMKKKKHEPISEPPSTKFVEVKVPILKPLKDVYELEVGIRAFEALVPSELMNSWVKVKLQILKLIGPEKKEIERILEQADEKQKGGANSSTLTSIP